MCCRSVLLAYALYDPMVGYTQGMTDLLAPLLVSLEDEAMSFWCFTKLVERSVFFKPSSVSVSMDSQLVCIHKANFLLHTVRISPYVSLLPVEYRI